MVDAHDSSLEQRPNILASVGVDIPMNIGFRMVHGLMGKLGTIKSHVRSKLISVNFRSRLDVFADEIGNHCASDVLQSLHMDFA